MTVAIASPALKRPADHFIDEQHQHTKRKVEPAEELRAIVLALLERRAESHFPVACLETVHQVIAPMIEEHAQRDTILLPQQDAVGKSLKCILVLAAACAVEGMTGLVRVRAMFDQSRLMPTRNWISWLRAAQQSTPCLKDLRTTKWSFIRGYFAEPEHGDCTDDDDMTNLDDAIVKCFMDHEVESLPDLVDFVDCAVCHRDFADVDLVFYRCQRCELDFCAECEERRVNFK